MTKSKYNYPEISMKIILPAGDARTKANEAFDAAMNKNFDLAYSLLKEANEFIKQAHRAQTEVLQSMAMNEYNNEEDPEILPMLFIHAQDTIMTIMSEVTTAEKMIKLYEKVCKEK